MQKFNISNLSLADIETIVTLQETSGTFFVWEDISLIELTEAEYYDVNLLQKRLQNTQVHRQTISQWSIESIHPNF